LLPHHQHLTCVQHLLPASTASRWQCWQFPLAIAAGNSRWQCLNYFAQQGVVVLWLVQ
jgi:hypothetical protein